ncbi:glycosyl hydrolase family 28-related protein [Sphingomonas sp. LM7]|uniref:glycosyl hydrolase family 28-related protein n=1 Tax=Sphingomonas sp. LM7 TaxID=1938607 RepID=UPI000983B415|nr:glycosyl hydrolase family 28-related protein [Sphingomonas sp. LM7]AQR75538.1 hypothetical protein BXU08_19420 [Sphingomonas sp. LM7]
MPFDGSGTYAPPGPPVFPADPLLPIPALDYNATILDVAGALSDCLTRDGQAGMLADLDLGGFRATGLGAPTAAADAATRHYVDDATAPLAVLGIIPPGLPTDPAVDAAPAINAALADSDYGVVLLPPGTYGLLSSIVLQSGKTLRGAGWNLTSLVALDGFDSGIATNSLVYGASATTAVVVSDLAVDGGKVRGGGTIRLTGLQLRGTSFLVERTISRNCTGYGHFAQGDPGGFFYASGTFRDCWSYNCQIAFEQTASDGVLLVNCHARDGDGDLIGTYFHPLTRSRNITYLSCTAYGNAFAGVELIADASGPMDNIRIIGCTIQMLGNVPALVQSGVARTTNLQLLASRFVSAGGAASTDMTLVEGSAVQCVFDGGLVGSNWSGATMNFTNCKSIGRAQGVGVAAYGIVATGNSDLRWSGGSLEAHGDAQRFWTSVSAGSVLIKTPDTRQVPDGPNATFSAANLVVTANRTGADLSAGLPFAWDAADYDTDGYFDPTKPTRLTVRNGVGKVMINANTFVQDMVTTASVQMSIVKNGNKVLSSNVSNGTLSQGLCYTAGPISAVPGDYFEVWLGVSGDPSVIIQAARCNFSMHAVAFT